MNRVLSVSQMRLIDEKTINGNLAVGYSLMMRAGYGLLKAANEMLDSNKPCEIAVICGKGNNGGDGFVVGRMLLEEGHRVMCFLLCDSEDFKGESKLAFEDYVTRKGNFLVLNDAADLAVLSRYDLIIDAILGTGLKGDPRGLSAIVIDEINKTDVPVLSVDTPSGLNNDTGIPGNPCVKATVTVTMGFPKIGLCFYPGKEYVGKLVVCDLGYPDEIISGNSSDIFIPKRSGIRRLLPPRHPGGSKIDHGLALLVCGSRGMCGSATLASQAALRSGCGMTHLAAPESSVPVLSTKLTETVIHPVNETNNGSIAYSALDQVKKLSLRQNAVCIGPGLTRDSQTGRFVRAFVKSTTLPAVIDADGINAFVDYKEELKKHSGEIIITPHRGEWRRLFGDLPDKPIELVDVLKRTAAKYSMSILLKGNPTIIVSEEQNVYIMPFGNSSLAKSGTGDVLSGILVSLLAQGVSLIEAAILGNYIHSEAGVLAAETLGKYSVIASDVVNMISRVILSFKKHNTIKENDIISLT